MKGKTVAITGGNTGLGKEAAIRLASLGAHIIILSRASSKTDQAVEEIKRLSGRNGSVESIPLDLADLSNVRQCGATLRKRINSLDVLMNNAGIMAVPTRQETKDGFEAQLGTNHLGHFLLTKELWPLLQKSQSPRVISVASSAHLIGGLNKSDLMLADQGAYGAWKAYGNSKLANILFTRHLAKLVEKSQSKILAVSCHPGIVRTELSRYLQADIPAFLHPLYFLIQQLFRSPLNGAQTQIMLAASERLTIKDGGEYFENCQKSETNAAGKDLEMAEWLWKESERLTGGSFKL